MTYYQLSYPAHPQPVVLPKTGTARMTLPLPPKLHASLRVAQYSTSSSSKKTFPGPAFSRQQLEQMASGDISVCFGEWFKPLDQYHRLIRMPEPPLLLADRVLGIEGEPGSFKTGIIWTETDVTADAWYLHHNHMPAGFMIESGQADLLLISWLGFDFFNKSERVYRLLGCDLTYFGGLPKVGDTLHYEIHIDSHAKHGDIRLFFFHYDCYINGEPRLRVRNGQAGFFTDEELASSGGVLWDANQTSIDSTTVHAAPRIQCATTFNEQQLDSFLTGNITACFGNQYFLTESHTRTPQIAKPELKFLNRITHFNPEGGPWQRGYLRAEQDITPNDWFFKGHFKNDPCFPGTLMFEACLQAMSFYLTGLGFTVDKDGWRFEPVPETEYSLRCRGQVIPTSKQVVYEIFVTQVIADPIPTLHAYVMATVDGLKAFHTHMGLRLIPDWPFESVKHLLDNYQEKSNVASFNGFSFDYKSLLACAVGRPSTAFGEGYKVFDSHRRVARLPGPPYHFMTRILSVDQPMWQFKSGINLVCEYDIPNSDTWYFAENNLPTMPFCVLLEAVLQPCGWLASYIGSTLKDERDLLFRNLDGKAVWHMPLGPLAGTLRTHVKATNIAKSGSTLIESFKVECFLEDKLILSMDTVFGFFPPESFHNQAGLAIPENENNCLEESSNYFVDLTQSENELNNQSLRLPAAPLLMIDHVTGWWQNGGIKGLGRIRAEKIVKPSEWFFKAHFFQDPVQPGSLGCEAIIQALQCLILKKDIHFDFPNPQFAPVAWQQPIVWKYRGQVTPECKLISIVVDLLDIQSQENQVVVTAQGSLWVDGKRIYEMPSFGITVQSSHAIAPIKQVKNIEKRIDLTNQPWLKDHCPTYVIPSIPMMGIVSLIADAAKTHFPYHKLIGMHDVQVYRWAIVDPHLTLKFDMEIFADHALVQMYDKSTNTLLGKGTAIFSEHYPTIQNEPILLPSSMLQIPDLYRALFHGSSFQIGSNLRLGNDFAIHTISGQTIAKDHALLDPIFMDALLHGIPHDNLASWSPEIPNDHVAYPMLIPEMHFYTSIPAFGELTCETRFTGFHHHKKFPKFEIILKQDDQILLSLILVEALFPKGPLGDVDATLRRRFLQNKDFVPTISLTQFLNKKGFLTQKAVKDTDWLPGSIAKVYALKTNDWHEMTQLILVKEYFGHKLRVHPSQIGVDLSMNGAWQLEQKDHIFHFVLNLEDNVYTLVENVLMMA